LFTVAAPSVPTITGWETGEDFVNVTWSPTSPDSDDNPGHKFSIQYKKHGQCLFHISIHTV